MEAINVLSPQLMKIVNDARPKRGQVIHFESLRLQAGGTSVKSVDRIFDPYVENEDGTKGNYADIGYVIGQLPAMGATPARHQFGRIQFSKSSGNIITTSGNNRGDDTLFLFLFLTNWNKMNIGKPWHAPSDGQMPLFTQQVPEMAAKEANDYRRKVRMAGEKIDSTPDPKLLDLALALDMRDINQFSDMEEIRNKLYLIAEGDPKRGIKGNPDKVLNMDKDVNLNMKLFIKEALKYNIWVEDKALKLLIWPDTQDPVFVMAPGQDLYSEAIKYLLGPGERTYNLVKGLIEKARSKEQKKKNYEPPSKNNVVGKVAEDAINAGDHIPEGKIVISKEVVEVKE